MVDAYICCLIEAPPGYLEIGFGWINIYFTDFEANVLAYCKIYLVSLCVCFPFSVVVYTRDKFYLFSQTVVTILIT